ncbi:hypothetical protein G6L30_08635 [Agrobacterium rhizogenes]|nr:hypothetical protein [Rhizobium rhizogenes]
MIRRVLLDNATFTVTYGLLGAYRITVKHRMMTRKAPASFRDHFNASMNAFVRLGGILSPGNEDFQSLTVEFAEAVWGSGARQTRYLITSPDDLAKEALGSYDRS